MKQDGITISKRYRLPHWEKEGGIYAVTFRLNDALPQETLARLKAELVDLTTIRSARTLRPDEEHSLANLEAPRIAHLLNTGYGSCWLQQEAIAELVATALQHFAGNRYRLFAWCIMPNHVHVVVQPLSNFSLSTIVHSWKSFTAHQANIALNRKGSFWQQESYDHLIRNEAELWHAIEYAWNNPDAAGMKEWKWRWKISEEEYRQCVESM